MKKLIILTLLICACGGVDSFDDVCTLHCAVSAGSDGSLRLNSTVTTNIKVAEFVLLNENGEIVSDFLTSDPRNQGFGTKNTGDFYVTFNGKSDELPINVYIVSAVDKNGERYTSVIGEKYVVEALAGDCFSLSSQNNADTLSIAPNGRLLGNVSINGTQKGTIISDGYIASFEVSAKNKGDGFVVSGVVIRGGNGYDLTILN